MSTLNSSIRTPWSHAGDAYFAPQIEIVDHTKPPEEDAQRRQADDSATEDEGSSSPQLGLSRRGTRSSGRTNLRKALEQRKYAKWTETRIGEEDNRLSLETTASTSQLDPGPSAEDSQQAPIIRQFTSASSNIRSGPRKLKRMLTTRKMMGRSQEGDSAVDVLYENQRGSFIFGYPLFSSRSLLNLDPAAWVTAEGRPSPVNIRNAQVPDPSWKWSWKAWYVDMSRDVDEEGWEYSFSFQKSFSWHGTHPFLHSFVRRRRWLRMREKKDRLQPGKTSDGKPLMEGHKLNADYFTIHPAKIQAVESSYVASTMSPDSRNITDEEDELEEINDIPTLLHRLKNATIDREKQNLILQFMDEGGDELQLLPDRMPFLMSQFMFQYSRRQLLTKMLQKMDAASDHRDEHVKRNKPESENEKQRIDSLLKAIKAADEQIQALEYWSDIKQMVQAGDSGLGADKEAGWDHGWDGIDSSGPEKVESATDKVAKKDATEEPPAPQTSGHDRPPSDHEPDSDSAVTDDAGLLGHGAEADADNTPFPQIRVRRRSSITSRGLIPHQLRSFSGSQFWKRSRESKDENSTRAHERAVSGP